jgi:hypothetical protein
MTQLRIRLEGAQATLGNVSASDFAQLIISVENAAARAASVALGRPKRTTGRYEGVVEQAIDFRLLAVDEGSVVAVLELASADDDGRLDLDAASLSQTALGLLLDAAARSDHHTHPVVAQALLEVADKLHVGERYEAIVFDVAEAGRPARQARVDAQVRRTLRDFVAKAATIAMRPDDLSGVLVEADFEKHTARLRTPTEASVDVSFVADQADEIQAALRHQTTARGDVVYDAHTHIAKSVRLTQLVHGEQLGLDADATEYWARRTLDELAAQQGLGNSVDPASLYNAELSDEEREAFMTAISELV